jgi:hypothetical protein
MNANELAEIIEHLENARYIGASKAATMLRQQQAEIEALKQIIDANNLNQNIGQFVKPTNEPVAWMETYKGEPNNLDWNKSNLNYESEFHDVIPLYTHPSEHDLGIAEAIGFEKGHKSAEDMLRQQQAEIEALKAGKIRAYDNGVEDGRKPNTNPVKELTREDRLKLIGTLKWAEDLLREAGHDEAVDEVQDCLMILRKAQEK